MKPSVFGSLAVFCLIGYFSLKSNKFETHSHIQIWLMFLICFSAAYYYYLNMAAEAEFEPIKDRPFVSRILWGLTAFQFGILASFWFLYREQQNAFFVVLLLLHFSYLLWDLFNRKQVWPKTAGKWMLAFDSIGAALALIICLLTVWPGPGLPKSAVDAESVTNSIDITAFVAIATFVMAAGFVVMIFVFRYSPFKLLAMDGTRIFSKKKTNGNP